MSRKILFHNKESREYIRTYANIAYINSTPSDVSLEFYEEYVEPMLEIGNGYEENEDDDVVNVCRMRKCSVVMSKQQALDLAYSILDRLGMKEKNTSEGDNNEN